jgi:hypothetical protein
MIKPAIAGAIILCCALLWGCSGDSSATKQDEQRFRDRNASDIHGPPPGAGPHGPPPGAGPPKLDAHGQPANPYAK